MKKDTLRGLIGMAVLLVVYILIAFLVPFPKTGTFWVSFLFTLLAFAVTAAALYGAFGKDPSAKSKFYGFPIARIGAVYGGFQLIAGFVCMLLGAVLPWWLAMLVFVVALAAAIIGLIGADAVVEEIHIQDNKLKQDVAMMRSLQSKVNQMTTVCDAPELKKLADELRFSDPVSSEPLARAEQDLAAEVDLLQQAVIQNDRASVELQCRKISMLLAERNRLCKLNKE